VLAPATLAALPSTRAIPDRDVFYVAHPIRSIREQGRATGFRALSNSAGEMPATTDLLRATVQALCRGTLSCRSGKRISFLILS
jgi:hypothetical protein